MKLTQAAQRHIMNHVVFPAMPTLRFHNETLPFAGQNLGSIEWVYLHAGLVYAQTLKMDAHLLSKEELLQLGFSLDQMISGGLVDPHYIFIFDQAAKIYHNLHQRPHRPMQTTHEIFQGVNASANALNAIFEAGDSYLNESNPVDKLISALENYKPRPKLADDLERATALFTQQNDDIANKYAVVDDMLLTQVLANLDQEESDFILSAHVTRIQAQFSFFKLVRNQMISRHLPRHSHTIGLAPEVDLLAAVSRGERRIYSLLPESSGYMFNRIDDNVQFYYALMTDSVTPRKDADYTLRIDADTADAGDAPVMKKATENLDTLIDNLTLIHKNLLSNKLYQYGFEETTGEKAQKFLLSLIPLYDCVSGIRAQSREAVLPCMLDALSLVPFIGKAGSLTTRVAQRGTSGAIVALRANLGAQAVRGAIKETLRHTAADLGRLALVPAAEELNRHAMISLGLTAVRTLDPGFELLTLAGMRSTKGLINIAKQIEGRVPVWKKNPDMA
ncbi:hypothetical protein ABK905_25390 [Acerihabitans sp. KWT182]|uniref:Uncharacterized protein n=1 Tax=Acerihabitans sp. KWT182 TaxID=3157919 RepID=A0AAU7Q8Z5_9GAMM